MGKRSNFERIPKDFYRTIDKRAVEALLPVLYEVDGVEVKSPDDAYGYGHFDHYSVRYAEPCAGFGDLLKQFKDTGVTCNWSSDIKIHDLKYPEPFVRERDALALTEDDLKNCDTIITNPPWSRPLLHKMILHFSSLKPTWLLFDADWMHTAQSAPYMKHCTDIVSVGRLIWIPGTTTSGKDNCVWYRFDQTTQMHNRETVFHGRRE